MKREFKVGDKVYSRHFGYGIITGIREREVPFYPIMVEWFEEKQSNHGVHDCFSLNGHYALGMPDPEYDIVPAEEEDKVGQIASVINSNISQKMQKDNEKMSPDDRKFKVGERVWSPYFGGGTVKSTEAKAGNIFPIVVHWDDEHLLEYDFFTEDGKYTIKGDKPEKGIYHIDPKDAEKVLPDILHELGEDEEEDNKKVEDAINPYHYKVEGLPEAIDIMNHLMTPEQFEGFLWGNIMKYAYRFGRKGDKGETAGKIAWYANQLKAVEEWRNENET